MIFEGTSSQKIDLNKSSLLFILDEPKIINIFADLNIKEMGIPRFFKLPNHKRFDYQPLYYDPVKEKREERNKTIASELGIKAEGETGYKPGITRGSMHAQRFRNKKVSRQSNFRLVLIIIFLFFVAWLILFR